ncbi:MAG: DUF5615 family PIN-like protein [Candidatus Schekmanbacteria bacterium]|nr:DUF5615 family PIN-like protein [Candidatus Schekmanbacteria bacterium]
MPFKLDENMPGDLGIYLKTAGFEVDTVQDEGLSGQDDEIILAGAINERRVLLTFDTDFCNIQKYKPETHSGIVVFRLKDSRWSSLSLRIKQILPLLKSPDLQQALVIVDDKRVRLRIQ